MTTNNAAGKNNNNNLQSFLDENHYQRSSSRNNFKKGNNTVMSNRSVTQFIIGGPNQNKRSMEAMLSNYGKVRNNFDSRSHTPVSYQEMESRNRSQPTVIEGKNHN